MILIGNGGEGKEFRVICLFFPMLATARKPRRPAHNDAHESFVADDQRSVS